MSEDTSHIESSIGRMPINRPNQKVLKVEDESYSDSENSGDLFRQAKDSREVRKAQETKLEAGVKRRLEILTNLGRATKDVVIDNIKFSLRSLKTREMRDTIKAVALLDLGSEQAFEIRVGTLSKAIYQIDNQPTELVVGENIEEFISEMDETIIAYLYSEYNKMMADNKAKYNFETKEGIQEVIEDTKK